MNSPWHKRHALPRRAKLPDRIAWHRRHQEHCGCRPIPPKLLEQIGRTSASPKTKAIARSSRTTQAVEVDPRFAPVVAAFAGDRQVTYGGKGFGSTGLKVNGKLFAMFSSKQRFVAKLPKDRVDELVRLGKGEYFDTGRGRLMREWVSLSGGTTSWVELAREALRFVRGGKA